ncbi:esterase family protein [Flavicella marina]|uniref:esterase family protein n=1 Tax=Flavicella marina TaxID=1475951 RepID=UPI0012658BA2|nr:alpha/beta hydrolase-fold protein [Flavicella marina]
MKRTYHKWFSPNLEKDMELLVFGHGGARVIFFPPRMGRFYDYENWHVVEALSDKINAGHLQVFCVDSVDEESFYNNFSHPGYRIFRHSQYEKYIIREVVPLTKEINSNPHLISAGCSLGAYHAVNIAMRHPHLFCKVVGMSGRYDLTESKGYFQDLLSGYHDTDVYFHMPNQYLKNLTDPFLLKELKRLDIILAIGKEDLFLASNFLLSGILNSKGVSHKLYEWNEEAHKARYWREMVKLYI